MLIDKNGKIFGKVSILDLAAILVLIIFAFFAILKILDKDITEVSQGDVTVKLKWTIAIDTTEESLKAIKVGDKIAELKKHLDAEVVNIEIADIIVSNLDSEGNIVNSPDPLLKRGLVEVVGTLPHQSNSYKLGKQEIRYGQTAFLESDCYRLAGEIVKIEELD